MTYHIWDISVTGAMHKGLETSAKSLGVTDPDRLLKALHAHAVLSLHEIIKCRRQTERRKPDMRVEGRPP